MARPQIHLRVSEDQKNRWQTYVEENGEYDTLTDLIRTSVEREISDVPTTQSGGNVDSGRLDTLDERTERILSRLDLMEEALRDTADAAYQSNKRSMVNPKLYGKTPIGRENAITIESLHDKQNKHNQIDITVRDLETLEVEGYVSSFEKDGETYYYREE
jgi:hypothetical protein